MDEEGDSSLQDLPEDVESLKSIISDLKKKEQRLIQEKKATENEFGKQRAKIKGIFMSKEEHIDNLQRQLAATQSEVEETKLYLKTVVHECDTLRTAASVLEASQKEEIDSLNNKYQEEMASLQHIMREAVQEARSTTAQQFEIEHHQLLSANKKLESQVKELKSSGNEGKGVMSAMTDAVAGVVRRTSPSSQSKDKEGSTLEEGMKKAQEDAEAWKSIVLPLEQELETIKGKLRNEQEKSQALSTKLKALEKETPKTPEAINSRAVEELQDKVKELNQYLDSERSSRTDLEMFVAVLNTQKVVLQEDADKMRKEIHNVCKLLEEEKTAHRELKKTWQMANDQFMDNLQNQETKVNIMWNIMSTEQRIAYKEKLKTTSRPKVGKLIDFGSSPLPSPVASVEKAVDVAQTLDGSKTNISDISGLSATNSFASIDVSDREDDDELGLETRKRSHSASDSTAGLDVHDVARHKSADDLSSGRLSPVLDNNVDAIRHSPHVDLEQRHRTSSNGGKIDWRGFEEAVKISQQSESNRSCGMCKNYEKQLQQVEAERQKYKNLSSNLQIALDQEKKALFEEQKLRSRLEQSVANAGQDAQMQINQQSLLMDKLDHILVDVQRKFAATEKEALAKIDKLTSSRNELQEELSRLRSEYSVLQDSALHQMTQMDSDSRLKEIKEQLKQVRSASKETEEKLRSEIVFLKDRVIAEQNNKDSMEEMLQGDVDTYKNELAEKSNQLKKEKQYKQEVEEKMKNLKEALKSSENKLKELEQQLDESIQDKKKIVEEVKALKNQIQSLTAQLNESETVQRDFVKLSQSLQMQIVQLQESEQEVRWEHKDDVTECHKCKKALNSSKDKLHCHHCGKIFCESCRYKQFTSVSSRRSHNVCELCYAMLSNDSKAVFNNHLNDRPS